MNSLCTCLTCTVQECLADTRATEQFRIHGRQDNNCSKHNPGMHCSVHRARALLADALREHAQHHIWYCDAFCKLQHLSHVFKCHRGASKSWLTLTNWNAVVSIAHWDQRACRIPFTGPGCCAPQSPDWHVLFRAINSRLIADWMTPCSKTCQLRRSMMQTEVASA